MQPKRSQKYFENCGECKNRRSGHEFCSIHASAPKLLETCRDVLDAIVITGHEISLVMYVEQLKEVIAKAEGIK